MVIYLCSKKYVVQYTKPSCKHAYCQITESGKAYLYSRKISNRYHRIPIIISNSCSYCFSPIHCAVTVFSGLFHKTIRIIGITIDNTKTAIEAIRLPIENHNGKFGCRSQKLSRYPGCSFSKFLISSRVSSLLTETMIVFFSLRMFQLLSQSSFRMALNSLAIK